MARREVRKSPCEFTRFALHRVARHGHRSRRPNRMFVSPLRLLVSGPAVGALAEIGPVEALGPLGQVGALLVLFFALVLGHVALHEGAHALTARALGLDVHSVSIGTGQKLLAWQCGSCVVELKAYPFSGFVSMGLPSVRCGRLRLFLATLAGPVVDVSWGVTGLWLLASSGSLLVSFLGCTMVMRACGVLIRSWSEPTVRVEGREVEPDLRQLRTISRYKDADLDLEVTINTFTKAVRKLADLGSAEDGSYWRALAAVCPSRVIIDIYRRAVDLAPPESLEEHLDAFCTCILMIGDEQWFEEGESRSRQLMDLAPESPTIQGTRGSFLVLAGQRALGRPILERVYEQSESAFDKAISAAILALDDWCHGNHPEAGTWLTKSRAWGNGTVPLPWIEERVTSGVGQELLPTLTSEG